MKYSISKLAFYTSFAIGLSVSIAISIRYVILPIIYKIDIQVAEAVKQFLYSTPIQWVTITIFLFVLTVLASRFFETNAIQKSLKQLKNVNGSSVTSDKYYSEYVRDRMKKVAEYRKNQNRDMAESLIINMCERDKEGSSAIFGMLGTAVQMMLAMGFFGTVWGISRSMFHSFTNMSGTSADQINLSLGQFTSGLSMALDTTVTALVCSIVSGLLITAIEWAEDEALSSLAEHLYLGPREELRESPSD